MFQFSKERTDEDDDAMFGEAALSEEDKILDVSGKDEVTQEELRTAARPAPQREDMDAIMRYEEDEDEPRSAPTGGCCIIS